MNDNIAPFLMPQTHTIRQAMEQLEKTEEKIVFVVDEESRLIGSLTDGDIRRWILSDGDLKAQVLQICNRKPYVVEEEFGTEQVRTKMLNGNLGCVPVVNSSREIVRLLFWKEMFQERGSNQAKAPPQSAGRHHGRGPGNPARSFHQRSTQATHSRG